MNRNSDPIHLLEIANPVPDPDRLPDGPKSVVEEIIGMTDTEPTRRSRLSVMLAAALLTVIVGAAAAWAVVRPEQTTAVHCAGNVIIPAASGDPVADCADELRRQGIEPVAMVAYVNEFGGIVVIEVGAEVPSGWRPLEEGFRQDVAIIELQSSIEDVTTGLEASCHTSDDATVVVERELARLGLEWTVAVEGDADGVTRCAYGFPEPDRERVLVSPIDGGVVGTEGPAVELGARLNDRLDNECLTVEAAALVAQTLALETGLDPAASQVAISSIIDATAECARANVNVGGTVFVYVRGPAGS